ncbi:DegT/DnrJ/EryC1/StrS aminotransferase family protein [Sphingopyxis sp. SE2]|jgi:dTDP-4-amino-4,6-dideoxygalactose transaminase|uniref:DegT/DnrJ/EryC1/StrS family aminotransferase n=1 Tax=unclassified Sphingopyxis TaxID=2614943 RepID=UPI00050DBA82|nr:MULTISPECIES: DegT/DnrJ/EryC1/StrS aminotransferase family protein [unclassified Sphingopyxis]KGB53675.1 Aminotransferase [Sphingopyxis sp. LC363]MDT7527880.1 DegT/DnrJ/EryC1/StrS aminotransferase family protein [Sphingopyxis sp. SE2]
MLNAPISPWPSFSDEEADRVRDLLLSNRVNYWTGDEGRNFETEFARWCGSPKAIALANGTLALDLALKALDIGPGDEVIVTPRTFIASVSTVVNAGATPVFADVDLNSGNIHPASIAAVLTDRTRAIVPVHLGGWPCDMDGIMDLAADRGIHVIEDCAQAHGAKVRGRSVGSIGDVGAWSFCQDKIMTTGGEGGMVTTADERLWDIMWSFKDHGKSWDAVYNRQHPPGFRWVHESFGTNWRMLEVQAAVGRIQLTRMEEWTARRTAIARAIASALAPFGDAVRVPEPSEAMTHAYYRQYAYVRPDGLKAGWSRDRIVATCVERGAVVMHGSCSEVYLERAFDDAPFRPAQRFPVARELGETSLMFLCHPTITDEELARILAVVTSVFEEASR